MILELSISRGKENIAVDALSRVFFMAWSEPQAQFLQELSQ